MINPLDLVAHVIRPVLQDLSTWRSGVNTPSAENLLLFTALVESDLQYLHQKGGGPAIGLWQVEPETHDDMWETYISRFPVLVKVLEKYGKSLTAETMHGNLYYNCAMARLRYCRVRPPLPAAADIPKMAEYWGKYYNTKNLTEDKARFVRLASLYGSIA